VDFHDDLSPLFVILLLLPLEGLDPLVLDLLQVLTLPVLLFSLPLVLDLLPLQDAPFHTHLVHLHHLNFLQRFLPPFPL